MIEFVVLAAGKGTRMHCDTPKCLVRINGKEMIKYLLEEIEKVNKCYKSEINIVIGFKKEEVKKVIGNSYHYIYQEKQLGTGHALLCALNKLDCDSNNIINIYGDMPFVDSEILKSLIEKHIMDNNDITIVTNIISNPQGYGRIVNYQDGFKIVEENELCESEKNIKEVNSGIFIGKKNVIKNLLEEIDNDNKDHEFYLTSIFKKATKKLQVGKIVYNNDYRLMGINDINTLKKMEQLFDKPFA